MGSLIHLNGLIRHTVSQDMRYHKTCNHLRYMVTLGTRDDGTGVFIR